MGTTFNERFGQHGNWRQDLVRHLRALGEWMADHDLLDPSVEERLHRLESRIKAERVMVAFVAEFSRGKSELINAIFFAGYGRRIMPASAGRTTMCPTELAYDPEVPACLRLLPIETRLQPQALMEWRAVPEQWTRIDLDVEDGEQLARSMEKVSETLRVSVPRARELGFLQDDDPSGHPMVAADGLVEVPRWRHALINLAHPLLRQGLVVLDTPGLNAIGAEPELTVSLIPQAQAAIFILSADTGVTKSDLTIWREHLMVDEAATAGRLAVLNKIDTLWDALSTPEQVHAQIENQRRSTAAILNLPVEQVLPVSAQKGLLAKVTGDALLLQASRLPLLEEALATRLIDERRQILSSAIAAGMAELRQEVGRLTHVRRRDLSEQAQELRGLRGKNTLVIQQMRARIEQEQAEFEASRTRIHALRSVHKALLDQIFQRLDSATLKDETRAIRQALGQAGVKLGAKRVYAETFTRLRAILEEVQGLNGEIQTMLGASFMQMNAEFGFSLQLPRPVDFVRYQKDLEVVEKGHVQFLGMSNLLRLAQPEFSDRLMRALLTRLRSVFDAALAELEVWNKSASGMLDAQLRERRRHFTRRIEAVERIEQAAGGLDARIAEFESQDHELAELDRRLSELAAELLGQPEGRKPVPGVQPAPA